MELNIDFDNHPPLRVFIGYDSREDDAWQVCAESLRRHTSIPLAIHALKQDRLRARGLYTRPADEPAATQFAFTRYLVPTLCNYEGFALFVDCDFLFTRDIAALWPLCDREAAVNVVKHDYVPRAKFKMDGEPQIAYPRKNWSSLMVFNNAKCQTLTPGYVNNSPAANLHRFAWTSDDSIHGLPQEWNWLEGEYEPTSPPPAAIHFTNGGPWHVEPRAIHYADLWMQYFYDLQQSREP